MLAPNLANEARSGKPDSPRAVGSDAVGRHSGPTRGQAGYRGLSQANGWRGEADTVENIQDRVANDLLLSAAESIVRLCKPRARLNSRGPGQYTASTS